MVSETGGANASALIHKLARPSRAYKLHAWLAMGGLALFLLLYFALAGWFGWTAWRLTFGAGSGARATPSGAGSSAPARPSSPSSCSRRCSSSSTAAATTT